MFRKLMFFSQIIREAGRKKYLVKKIRFLSSAEYWVLALLFSGIKVLGNIPVLESLWSPFLISWKKLELDFGHDSCWPCFCQNRVLREPLLKVALVFFLPLLVGRLFEIKLTWFKSKLHDFYIIWLIPITRGLQNGLIFKFGRAVPVAFEF